jgi:hypothetical protein
VSSACEICHQSPASIFLLVEQLDGGKNNRHRAHACANCFSLLMTMDAHYHGLNVVEVSQQDYNAHQEPPLAQAFNPDDR